MWKERKFAQELQQRQMEEERAKIPKANPYPYTTDIPVVCICSYAFIRMLLSLYN